MKNLLTTFCLLLLISCQKEAKYQESQLLGNWDIIEWNDITNNKKINADVSFTFEADSRYEAKYGNASEKGKYWIEADNLHTIEDEKAEKKVKIKTLTADTLIFGMNRAGNIEELVLIKTPK